MRVLYFSRDYTPHDHRFLSALAGTGHDVFYLRLERGPRQVEDRPVPSKITQIQWRGGKERFHWRSLPGYLLSLKRLIRRIKPDLIHAGPIQDVGLLAALSGFKPLLIMSWGFDLMQDADRNAAYRWITRYVLRKAAVFTSDCEATREKAVNFGVPPQRTVVFPWGVDLTTFSPRSEQRSSKGHFVVLCNRSWEPRYGVDVLARAFVAVSKQRRDVDLYLVGDGSQRAHICRILEDGGVRTRVTFAGHVANKDLRRWYHRADLYVSPSHVDGSSVSLLEAMACGLPVLVSDIPANKEWVTEGENGWLFCDGDANHLAEKILAAIAQWETLPRVGQSSRRVAELRADWKKNAEALMKVYRDLKGK